MADEKSASSKLAQRMEVALRQHGAGPEASAAAQVITTYIQRFRDEMGVEIAKLNEPLRSTVYASLLGHVLRMAIRSGANAHKLFAAVCLAFTQLEPDGPWTRVTKLLEQASAKRKAKTGN